MKARMFLLASLSLALLSGSCASQTPKPSTYRWTQFVAVRGQPDPVPIEWVSTPEGAFAHSIEIPDPVPKDSGYREGMTSEEYFEHLCRTQAGEFIYKSVDNVEGFYFMRPPNRPTDKDLMDRFKLEDPYTERFYQISGDSALYRGSQFINPPSERYKFIEEPRRSVAWQRDLSTSYVRLSGYSYDRERRVVVAPMTIVGVEHISARYAVTWRGVRRVQDRENRIAGSELIVVDRADVRVLGVLRNYAMSPFVRNTPDGIWWLNAVSCAQFSAPYRRNLGEQMYLFISEILTPSR